MTLWTKCAGNLANLDPVKDHPTFRLAHGNRCDEVLVNEFFEEEHFDTVVYFAAESHVDRSISGPDAFIETKEPLIYSSFPRKQESSALILPGSRLRGTDARRINQTFPNIVGIHVLLKAAKIRQELDFLVTNDFVEKLRETVTWLLLRETWWRPLLRPQV